MKAVFLLCLVFSLSINSLAVPLDLPKVTVEDIRINKLTKYISSTYKVKHDLAEHVVITAHNYGYHSEFPTAIDILAIIAIESRFDKDIVSYTNDKGLMQISYKPTEFDVENNMYDGVTLLRSNIEELKHQDAAIQAYNIGSYGYKKGKRNYVYLNRFKIAKAKLEQV